MSKYQAYPKYKDSGVDWLGVVPENWTVKKIGYVAYLKSGDAITVEQIESNGGYSVYGGNGLRGYTESFNCDGDYILIGRQGALCGNINYGYGKFWASEHAVVVYPLLHLNFKWLGETLRSMNLNQYNVSAAQPGLAVANITSLKIPFPDIYEQQKIANFLDHETAKIDTLIAKQQQLIALLKEKRQAVISHAVTKGLNPNSPMRDSGVEWLGEMPAHWVVAGFKKYLNKIVDYRGKTPEKYDTGAFLVTARNLKGGRIDYEASQEYVSNDDYENIMSRGKPKIGEVLFTTEAPLGEVALVDREDIALAQRIIKFDGQAGILNNTFLKYFIMSNSFQASLIMHASGSTALGIKTERLVYLRALIPPEAEQLEIVSHIEAVLEKVDTLITKAMLAIELMQERRTALISAAVTGKIDVRGWQAPESLAQVEQQVSA